MGDFRTNATVEHGKTAARLRALQHALQEHLLPGVLSHAHVRAHSDDPINEMVDKMAKRANKFDWPHPFEFPNPEFLELIAPHVFDMLWLYMKKKDIDTLPKYLDGEIKWSTTYNYEPDDTCIDEIAKNLNPFKKSQQQMQAKLSYDFTLATYNALSLGDQVPKQMTVTSETGRTSLLRLQAHHLHILILGIQEARSKPGITSSSTHFRFASGATEAGTHGIEIGFSKILPLAEQADGKKIHFQERFFHVQRAEHDRLVVKYESTDAKLVVAALHAPHNGRSLQQRLEWWQTVKSQLSNDRKGLDLIILLDANARLGPMEDGLVGSNSDDAEDANGHQLRQLCHELQVFPPSTWHQYHYGDNHTWSHPGGIAKARLDYVLIPASWWNSNISTWTELKLHAGHALPDHTCAMLRTSWTTSTTRSIRRKIPFDNHAISKPENKGILERILAETPQQPWELNASEHAMRMTQHLHGALADAFPNNKKRRQPQHVSAETQGTYDRITSLRRTIRSLKTHRNLAWLRLAFEAWADRPVHEELHLNWLASLEQKQSQQERDLLWAAGNPKGSLKKDRVCFVKEIAQQVKGKNVSEIYKTLRPILPRAKGPGGIRPLQRVKKTDGSYSTSREEYDARWIEHFSAMEAGKTYEAEDFVRKSLEHQATRILPTDWNVEELPQLSWIEAAVRRLQRGKAPGPDAIINDVFKSSPATSAKLLLPLLWKLCLRLEEPLAAKGGQIVPVFKHRGAADQCSSYRGIMLLNTFGKIMRSCNRSVMMQKWIEGSQGMQMGGKPCLSVLFGAQAVRHAINDYKNRGASLGIIFADVESAYYKVVRQYAAGALRSDEDLAKVVQAFNLDAETMHEIHAVMHGSSGFESLGASSYQMALLKETFQSTWITVTGEEVINTTRGTRPGDNWADVIFGVILGKLLDRLLLRLDHEGLLPKYFVPAMRSPFEVPLTDKCVSPFHSTWADDLALLVPADKPEALASNVATVYHALDSEMTSAAMKLSIGDHKTAALLLPRGPGAVKVRRCLFAEAGATLPVLTERNLTALPLIAQYRHLGGIVAAKEGMCPELRARAARANAAFWKAAKKVYRSPEFPLATRMELHRSTVLSIWFWGAGAWPFLTAKGYKIFETTTWRFYGRLLHKPRGPEPEHIYVIFVSSGFIFMTVSFEISFILFYFILYIFIHTYHTKHTHKLKVKNQKSQSQTHTHNLIIKFNNTKSTSSNLSETVSLTLILMSLSLKSLSLMNSDFDEFEVAQAQKP